jgi:hypothetical protein
MEFRLIALTFLLGTEAISFRALLNEVMVTKRSAIGVSNEY